MLNRRGASTADGFFYAAIHGEFDPTSERYRLHLHGISGGQMTGVVKDLRKGRSLKSGKGDFEIERVRSRVEVSANP